MTPCAKVGEWISVRESMPVSKEPVIIRLPRGDYDCVVWDGKDWISTNGMVICYPVNFWMRVPEIPKPDPFEKWWKSQRETPGTEPDHFRNLWGNTINRFTAKTIWDAAIQSTKESA